MSSMSVSMRTTQDHLLIGFRVAGEMLASVILHKLNWPALVETIQSRGSWEGEELRLDWLHAQNRWVWLIGKKETCRVYLPPEALDVLLAEQAEVWN